MAITYLFTPEKTEVRLNGQDLCVTPELMVCWLAETLSHGITSDGVTRRIFGEDNRRSAYDKTQ